MDLMTEEEKNELVQKFIESSAAIDEEAAADGVIKSISSSSSDDDDGDDDMGTTIGVEEESSSHTYYCTRDGLFYKTYSDMVEAKKRWNQNHLRNIGLDRAVSDLKEASSKKKTTTTNNKKKQKQQQQDQNTTLQPLRRSTRRRIPVLPPPPPPPSSSPPSPPPPPNLRRSTRTRIPFIPYAPPLPSSYSQKNEKGISSDDDLSEEEGGLVTNNGSAMSDDDNDEEDEEKDTKIDNWTIQYRELKNFRKETGHCKVPYHYPPNQSLGYWANHQRRHYRQFFFSKGMKKTQITKARIDKLNKIGFHWGRKGGNASSSPAVSWECRFNQLKKYYNTVGHCNVKVKARYADCSPLAKWVRVQRFKYYFYHNNKKGSSNNNNNNNKKKNSLTKDRIQKLNKLGFDWNGPRAIS